MSDKVPPFADVIRRLTSLRSYPLVVLGVSLCGFFLFGMQTFLSPFLVRNFQVDSATAGYSLAAVVSIGSLFGALFGGRIMDYFGKKDLRWYCLLPALLLLVAIPLILCAFLLPQMKMAMVLLTIATIPVYTLLPASLTMTTLLVEPRMRASAAAFASLFMVLVGGGVGPFVVGFLSSFYAELSLSYNWGLEQCVNAAVAQNTCLASYADALGVKLALLSSVLPLLIASVSYFVAGRSYGRECGEVESGVSVSNSSQQSSTVTQT